MPGSFQKTQEEMSLEIEGLMGMQERDSIVNSLH